MTTSDGLTEWMYPRSNSILVVQFDKDGIVKKAGARAMGGGTSNTTKRRMAEQSSSGQLRTNNGFRDTGTATPVQ
jgi:hypothetical protein